MTPGRPAGLVRPGHQEDLALVLHHVVHAGDVLVREGCGSLGLLEEPATMGLVIVKRGRKPLEGYLTVQASVPG